MVFGFHRFLDKNILKPFRMSWLWIFLLEFWTTCSKMRRRCDMWHVIDAGSHMITWPVNQHTLFVIIHICTGIVTNTLRRLFIILLTLKAWPISQIRAKLAKNIATAARRCTSAMHSRIRVEWNHLTLQ